jgi:hypothetical protein
MIKLHAAMPAPGFPIFVPTADVELCRPDYAQQAWEPFTELSYASFVDDVFTAGATVTAATKLADAFEEELKVTWNQTSKPVSEELIVPRGVSLSKVNLKTWNCQETTK